MRYSKSFHNLFLQHSDRSSHVTLRNSDDLEDQLEQHHPKHPDNRGATFGASIGTMLGIITSAAAVSSELSGRTALAYQPLLHALAGNEAAATAVIVVGGVVLTALFAMAGTAIGYGVSR